MEGKSIVHSDSVSPSSLSTCFKLSEMWELDLFDGRLSQRFPADPHNTFGSQVFLASSHQGIQLTTIKSVDSSAPLFT